MSMVALAMALSLVGVSIVISANQRLVLEKEIMIGTIRAFIQLMAIGYVLKFIFDLRQWPYVLLMLAVMITVAGINAAKRGKGIPHVFWLVTGSIAFGAAVTLGVLVGLRIIRFEPWFVIPIGGMIIGNAMVASGLVLNRIQSEIAARRQEIRAALALGATARQAVDPALKAAIKAGMLPTIDSMKVVGLVQLPGMMTGQIIAGASPLQAVRYQIMVAYMLTAATAVTCVTLGLVVYRKFFTAHHQLLG
ncbi:MAG: ABC transporter permease [Syntrophothermus sp.]